MSCTDENPITQAHWAELYRFVLRLCSGRHEDAEDLTQEVFGRLLENGGLARFRAEAKDEAHLIALLKKTARRLVVDTWRREHAEKRGGGKRPISLDDPDHSIEITASGSDGQTYRQLEHLAAEGEERLGEEYRRRGEEDLFEGLRSELVPDSKRVRYALMSSRTGISETSLRIAVYHARKRYRQIMKDRLGLLAA